MAEFTVNEMLDMQRALQEKYKDKWQPLSPAAENNQLLWMMCEVGEVIDIVKKHVGEDACKDPELRSHLVEELADVLMFYNDILLCYGITADELKAAYEEKHKKNMNRW
jgi:NTP pyrophosphatase (non-canonical NTP hydrolase)